MATYSFTAITAAQALAITAADTLVIDLGSGQTTTVLFSGPDQVTISVGDRTVVFGLGVASATKTYPAGGALFIGTTGDDQRSLDAGSDGLYGGAGADTLGGGAAGDLLQGNQGADSLNGGAGADIVYGGQDNDVIDTGATGSATDFGQGNRGDDVVLGSIDGSDTLLGGQGNDLINATGVSPATFGDVTILSPTGSRISLSGADDFLNGNLGDDTIFGGGGNDRIFGEGGNDYLQDAGGLINYIDGGDGNDSIAAANASGLTSVVGGLGDDKIFIGALGIVDAGAGNDVVGFFTGQPGGGAYVIRLGDGDDFCIGVGIVDSPLDATNIDGGAGEDLINGHDGLDTITGGAGNDTIDSWAGADTVAGGSGSDQFQYYGGETTTVLDQVDMIVDWSSEDRLYFEPLNELAIGAGTQSNYTEGSAGDYASALTFANGQVSGGVVNYVAVQVGSDVYVFADSLNNNGAADSAVRLVGRNLSDIGFANFDGVTRLAPDLS